MNLHQSFSRSVFMRLLIFLSTSVVLEPQRKVEWYLFIFFIVTLSTELVIHLCCFPSVIFFLHLALYRFHSYASKDQFELESTKEPKKRGRNLRFARVERAGLTVGAREQTNGRWMTLASGLLLWRGYQSFVRRFNFSWRARPRQRHPCDALSMPRAVRILRGWLPPCCFCPSPRCRIPRWDRTRAGTLSFPFATAPRHCIWLSHSFALFLLAQPLPRVVTIPRPLPPVPAAHFPTLSGLECGSQTRASLRAKPAPQLFESLLHGHFDRRLARSFSAFSSKIFLFRYLFYNIFYYRMRYKVMKR